MVTPLRATTISSVGASKWTRARILTSSSRAALQVVAAGELHYSFGFYAWDTQDDYRLLPEYDRLLRDGLIDIDDDAAPRGPDRLVPVRLTAAGREVIRCG